MGPLLFAALLLTAATSHGEQQTSQAPFPVVQTKLGAITGRVLTARNGRQYEGFRGIPYAKPPVGELRFSKPQPLLAFEHGQLDADDFRKMCWQDFSGLFSYNASIMSEDCLFLNAFRPMQGTSGDSSQRQLRPVFVFIHGGAFVTGSSSFYEPGQLVTEGDIIVVTVNYRLGIFGFLSTGSSILPGNYGLWDQLLAIRWVKDNIRAFGGDPGQITVGGESAGAVSTAFHSLSSASRGLFNRAILQSGAATSSGAIQRWPLKELQALAKRVRCELSGSSLLAGGVATMQDLVICLRKVSPEELMAEQYPDRTLARAALDFVYVPVVDGDIVSKDPADTMNDKEYLTEIGFYERDYLSGCLNNEGGYFANQVQALTGNVSLILNPDFYDRDLVPLLMEKRFGKSSQSAEQVATFFYTYPRYPGTTQLDLKQVLDTPGDTFFYVPITEFARAVAGGQRSERRNLVYFFDHYPAYIPGGDKLGTPHAADILYEFDMDSRFFGDSSLWNVDDDHLRQVFMSMIVGFVETGNPSTLVQSYLQGDWDDFDLSDEIYLSIKPTSLTPQSHLRARQVSLWVDLIPRLLDTVLPQGNHSSTHVPTLSELVG